MRILITGANGQLAKTFAQIFDSSKDKLFLFAKKELDITDRKQVLQRISKLSPDIVLHFASMTRGDECARFPRKAYEINVMGTKNIVDACKKINATLLLISTNEVFDGKKKIPYSEKDKAHPITIAGITKYEAEKIVTKTLRKYYIVRTSWLFSKWSNNFLNTIINMSKSNKEIKLVTDEISSPTYSVDLSLAIIQLIHTKKYGLYNLCNTGKASRFKFAEKALKMSGNLNTKLLPIKLRDYERISKPPLFTSLSNKKAKRLGIILPKWEDALRRFLIT